MNTKDYYYGYDDKNIYLDNGASTLSLNAVKSEGDKFLIHYGSLHRGSGFNSEISTQKYENARNYILKTIHGTSDDCLIFTSNTTDAINKFTLIFPWDEGDKVLLSDIEHTSNYLPIVHPYIAGYSDLSSFEYLKDIGIKCVSWKGFRYNPENMSELELYSRHPTKIRKM